jgi:hypothetical protein
MCEKPCKECPWTIRNHFNDMIINHSKKHNKPHNCHMISPDKRGGLWEIKKEKNICNGRKKFETEYNNNN